LGGGRNRTRFEFDGCLCVGHAGEAGIDGIDPEPCGPLREEEQRVAAARVGVDVVEFLNHRDGVIEYGLALRRDLSAAIRRHRLELKLVRSPAHRHRCHRRGRRCGNRWIFPELIDQRLQPWNGVKRIAIAAHGTHLAALGGEMADARSFVTGSAARISERFGGRPAVSFEVIG